MAQQINLHTPILLRPRRIFSAPALAASLGLLAGVLLLACLGLLWLQQGRARAFEQISEAQRQERQQLTATLQRLNQRQDPSVLDQQLRGVQQDIAQLQQQLAMIDQEQLAPGQRHSDSLALLARTVPGPVWLTQLRLAPDQWEISGMTLDPAALQSWIVTLDAQTNFANRPWRQVRIEQVGPGAPKRQSAALSGPPLATAPPTLQTAAWAFRLANPARTPQEISP